MSQIGHSKDAKKTTAGSKVRSAKKWEKKGFSFQKYLAVSKAILKRSMISYVQAQIVLMWRFNSHIQKEHNFICVSSTFEKRDPKKITVGSKCQKVRKNGFSFQKYLAVSKAILKRSMISYVQAQNVLMLRFNSHIQKEPIS